MCDEGAGTPCNSNRADRLKKLCEQLSLDAILLITGFDGCFNLEAKGLVEWLCDCGAVPATDLRAAALEEGLFVAMPNELAWHVIHNDDDMSQDAVSALDRLLADPTSTGFAHTPAADTDVDMSGAATPTAPTDSSAAQPVPVQQQFQSAQDIPLDGKMSLLLQLQPRLRRVGIALGVEVRGGVQQQVPVENIFSWPLLLAASEHLSIQPEQLFQEVVDITPTLRTLLGYVDGTHLWNILRARRPLLTRAWFECMAVCGRRINAGSKLDLTEAAIAAPVTEFVSGCGCRLKPGQYQPLALPPRVLFGTRTTQQEALSNVQVSLRSQAAKQGTAVLHATVEAADACSPLRVARTIFFSQGAGAAEMPLQLRLKVLQQQQQQQDVDMDGCHSPQSAAAAVAANGSGAIDRMSRCDSGSTNNSAECGCCSKQSQQQQQQQSSKHLQKQQASQQQLLHPLPISQALANGDYEADQVDLFDLMCWYWAAVDAAWQCMEYYSTHEGATWQSAHAFATQAFWSAAATAQLVPLQQDEHNQQAHQPKLQLQLFSWDGGPRPMPSGANLEQHNHRFKTLRVTVSDICSRSTAHPGMMLGNVLYMDSFVDVPAVGDRPPRLINVTLTHCPTYTFDLWGTEAALNNGRIAAFRRHLQIQLQSQLQVDPQAQAAAMRRSADDSALLRMQLQQGQGAKGGKGLQRRASMGQQQQFMLMQQLAASGGCAGRGTAQQQRQQLLLQLQQGQQQQAGAQKGRGAGGSSGGGGRQEPAAAGRGSKHSLGASMSCCGEPEAPVAAAAAANAGGCCDGGTAQQAPKRSCCGSNCSTGPAATNHNQLHDGVLEALLPGEGSSAAAAAGATRTTGGGTGSSNGSGSNAAVAAAAVAAAQCWRHLGRLLVPPGELPGEVALVLTGAMKLAVMDGPLYVHSNGLVFVSRPTKVHVLLLDQMEAVWLQDFASRMPGYPDIGPCIVIKGKQPCCGLLPATHMTDNCHVSIPLRAMSKAGSQHFVTAVLPAWQAVAGLVKASKGAAVPWPLPAEYQPFYTYWVQGPRKRYMLPQPDEEMDQLVQVLDRPQHQHTHQHVV